MAVLLWRGESNAWKIPEHDIHPNEEDFEKFKDFFLTQLTDFSEKKPISFGSDARKEITEEHSRKETVKTIPLPVEMLKDFYNIIFSLLEKIREMEEARQQKESEFTHEQGKGVEKIRGMEEARQQFALEQGEGAVKTLPGGSFNNEEREQSLPGESEVKDVAPETVKSKMKAIIGEHGKEVELYGFKIDFPKNAVDEDIEFSFSIDNNRKNFPTNKGYPIGPILEVEPPVKFNHPVTVKMITWYSAAKGKTQTAKILSKERGGDWKTDQKVVLGDKNEITFEVQHFCGKIATVEEESNVKGLHYFINDVFIQRKTGTIISAFIKKDLLSQDQLRQRIMDSDFVLTPHSKDICGNLKAVFDVTIDSIQPKALNYRVLPNADARFKISEALHQKCIQIEFFTLQFPKDFHGTLVISHHVTPRQDDGQWFRPDLLSYSWPIPAAIKQGNQNININPNTAMNMNVGGSMDLNQTNTKNQQDVKN